MSYYKRGVILIVGLSTPLTLLSSGRQKVAYIVPYASPNRIK